MNDVYVTWLMRVVNDWSVSHNRFRLHCITPGQVASTQGHNKGPYGRGLGGDDWHESLFRDRELSWMMTLN
jgi:hypothetical protein